MTNVGWDNVKSTKNISFDCGFCGRRVSSNKGWDTNQSKRQSRIRICPNCKLPSLFLPSGDQIPSPLIGDPVQFVPEKVNELYEEARKCATHEGFTAAVLACRKILMHIAVDKGADDDLSFKGFVEYLDEEGHIPPEGKGWIDEIRKLGNEANHEIVMMDREEANKILTFIKNLLRIIYKLPEEHKREK